MAWCRQATSTNLTPEPMLTQIYIAIIYTIAVLGHNELNKFTYGMENKAKLHLPSKAKMVFDIFRSVTMKSNEWL